MAVCVKCGREVEVERDDQNRNSSRPEPRLVVDRDPNRGFDEPFGSVCLGRNDGAGSYHELDLSTPELAEAWLRA